MLNRLMHRPASWFAALICLAVVVVGTGVAVVRSDAGTSGPAASVLGETILKGSSKTKPSNPGVLGNGSFRVVGAFDGLYPGINASLALTVSNDNNFDIVVQSLSATATAVDPDHAACPLKIGNQNMVQVTTFSGALVVAANTSAAQALPITMNAASPDACAGATFTLTYGGSAVKANQP